MWRTAGLVIVLVMLASAATGCAAGGDKTAGQTSTPASGGEQEIVLKNTAFVPATVTIKAGTTVRWVNQDGYSHTVTAGTRGAPTQLFDSGNLGAGQSFTFTFKDAGVYPYFCATHPGMDGEITVQ
jgi:plastocyanin